MLKSDNTTWMTENLTKRFRDEYRKNGTREERRKLNIKYSNIGCDRCADKSIQCTTQSMAIAMRCNQCPQRAKCTRVDTIKKLRVTETLDINGQQYDYLLHLYKQGKQEEPLEHSEDTFRRASVGVARDTKPTVISTNHFPYQYPPLKPTEAEFPSKPGSHSRSSGQSSLEIRRNTNAHILNQQQHSAEVLPEEIPVKRPAVAARDDFQVVNTVLRGYINAPSEVLPKEMPVNRPVGARDSFQAVNAVLQGHIIAPSFLPEEMPVNGPAVAACDDFVLQRFSRYPLSPEFGGPMLPISSIHHIPTAPYYSPQPPYLLPAHLLPAHLYAPIPFAFPNDLSLTKYENSNNVATSSNAASATSASSQVYFGADHQYPKVDWDQETTLPMNECEKTTIARAEQTNLVPGPSVDNHITHYLHYGS